MMALPPFFMPPGIGTRGIPLEDELRWGNAIRDLAQAEAHLEGLRAQGREAFDRMIRLLGLRQQAVGLWAKAERRHAASPTRETARAMAEAQSIYRQAVERHEAARAEVDRVNAEVRKAEARTMSLRSAVPQRYRSDIGRVMVPSAPTPYAWARFAPGLPRLSYWGT